jgi:hypothetical protein
MKSCDIFPQKEFKRSGQTQCIGERPPQRKRLLFRCHVQMDLNLRKIFA